MINEIANTTSCPSPEVYHEFTDAFKTILRAKKDYTTTVQFMNATTASLLNRVKGTRNVGRRQIEVIYILMEFHHHHLTVADINDIMALSSSYAGFYWYTDLHGDGIITGDRNDVCLSDNFMGNLKHVLLSPTNSQLLVQKKAYGRFRRKWNSQLVKAAKIFVRENRVRFYPLQTQQVHELGIHSMAFMQTFRGQHNIIENCLRTQPFSPY
jgi:hypothetical protein